MKTFFVIFQYESIPIEEVKADYFRVVDGIVLFYNNATVDPHAAFKSWSTVAETLPIKTIKRRRS